jgi:hypothetical protein
LKIIKITITIFLAHIFFCGYAGDGIYAVNKIPVDLLKNANVVKRFEDLKFEILNTATARLSHRVVLTILNEEGDKHAVLEEYYNKLHVIESMEGRLFDAQGKKIQTLKKSDIKDLSGTSDDNLADDNRVKQFSFYHKVYPYTVEYEIEVKFNYTLFYPGWVPQEDESYAVEYSKTSVVCPHDIEFRYKAYNYPGLPEITTEKNTRVYSWQIKNLTAFKKEYASPMWYELTPVVCMGPVQFQIGDYLGNMSSWQDFGKFVFSLNKGRDELPTDIKATVHRLTDDISNTQEKIKILYDFFQKNTRYVSVQLGIGGWQPFDAHYVATNRYGDCKALSNYMFSLLKEAGVKSYYTLVKAGDDKHFFIDDFPSSQFDHVILCVPVKRDTTWLECTNQTIPAGYLGSFTCNRTAFLVDENGGTLVQTPRYGLKENLRLRKTIGSIDEEGNLAVNITTDYKAVRQDNLHELISRLSNDRMKEVLKEEIDLPNYDVIKFNYKESPGILPVITETLDITDKNYAQVTGARLFLIPNIISRSHLKLDHEDTRKFDILLNNEYHDIDTVEIKIPAGYKLEAAPADVDIKNKFGHYSTSTKLTNDKIVYYRSMEKYKGRFPPTSYDELVKFNDQVYKSDRASVVFIKM